MKKHQHNLLTKIMVTLGPASMDPMIMEQLIKAGARIFRINFSHGTFDQHALLIGNIRQVSTTLNIPVAIVGDLCGPKIRIGQVEPQGIHLDKEQVVIFKKEPITAHRPAKSSDPVVLSTTFPDMINEVRPGHQVLLDDGAILLMCTEQNESHLYCRVIQGGLLTSSKGVNLPDTDLSTPALTERDRECTEFAVQQQLDYLALSFVRSGQDVRLLKQQLVDLGARPEEDLLDNDCPLQFSAIEIEREGIIPIISKIEKPQAIEHLDEILRESDGIMVARGDLGVEMDLAEVAVHQKRIIEQCQSYGLPVIVATQMLQSMIQSPTPTRAEVSDVANAIFDGADAVMLSGETAVGQYPIEAVRMMNRIADKAHDHIMNRSMDLRPPIHPSTRKRQAAAIANGTRQIVQDLEITMIITWAQYGGSAVYLSQQRLSRPILAFSSNPSILRRLSLLYGVTPVYSPALTSQTDFLEKIDRFLLDQDNAYKGDLIATVYGIPMAEKHEINHIGIHCVGDGSKP